MHGGVFDMMVAAHADTASRQTRTVNSPPSRGPDRSHGPASSVPAAASDPAPSDDSSPRAQAAAASPSQAGGSEKAAKPESSGHDQDAAADRAPPADDSNSYDAHDAHKEEAPTLAALAEAMQPKPADLPDPSADAAIAAARINGSDSAAPELATPVAVPAMPALVTPAPIPQPIVPGESAAGNAALALGSALDKKASSPQGAQTDAALAPGSVRDKKAAPLHAAQIDTSPMPPAAPEARNAVLAPPPLTVESGEAKTKEDPDTGERPAARGPASNPDTAVKAPDVLPHAAEKTPTATAQGERSDRPSVHIHAAAAEAPASPLPAANTTVSTPGLQIAAVATAISGFSPPAARPVQSGDRAIPLSGLAVEITTRAHDGQHQFDIRLDPPELGRIDVRLHVDKDGGITSRLIVDRPETLDMLRRDAANLERALQSSGLKTEGGLEFLLRDQSFAGRDQSSHHTTPSATVRAVIVDETLPPVEAGLRNYGRLLGLGSGVDIRI